MGFLGMPHRSAHVISESVEIFLSLELLCKPFKFSPPSTISFSRATYLAADSNPSMLGCPKEMPASSPISPEVVQWPVAFLFIWPMWCLAGLGLVEGVLLNLQMGPPFLVWGQPRVGPVSLGLGQPCVGPPFLGLGPLC